MNIYIYIYTFHRSIRLTIDVSNDRIISFKNFPSNRNELLFSSFNFNSNTFLETSKKIIEARFFEKRNKRKWNKA